MNSAPRLTALAGLRKDVSLPQYNPASHGNGIVHLGVGAFHKAHQAVYTDDALAAGGGDWRITGVSLRGTAVADAINPQNGLYTLIERGAGGTRGRVIASIAHVIAASRDRPAVLQALCDPATRIVSLTVTEKAYGIDRVRRGIDANDPTVAADLADPRHPVGVLGLIVESLRLRHAAGHKPFTVLCCDNLPENGHLLRAGVVDFAQRIAPILSDWITRQVPFPSTMVDRITPAATDTTLAVAKQLTGHCDLSAVETEPFTQWVIEDSFCDGRPQWEAGGALFVDDVAPFERMKLRMLNGTHSMLAYAGFLSGCAFVRDVMADTALAALVERHLQAAAATLAALPGIDFTAYGADLAQRFCNPAIAHETYQIAMDGTQKLPQRILSPAAETLAAGRDIQPFAFATAAWMRYCLGRTDQGEFYALRDPREDEIRAALGGSQTPDAISDALHKLPNLFDDRLRASALWRKSVAECLASLLQHGVRRSVALEAERIKPR